MSELNRCALKQVRVCFSFKVSYLYEYTNYRDGGLICQQINWWILSHNILSFDTNAVQTLFKFRVNRLLCKQENYIIGSLLGAKVLVVHANGKQNTGKAFKSMWGNVLYILFGYFSDMSLMFRGNVTRKVL